MSIQGLPDFLKFLNTALMDVDQEQDGDIARAYAEKLSADARERLGSQVQSLLAKDVQPLEDFGSEANRWFGDDADARSWLQMLAISFGSGSTDADSSDVVVKDSNGTVLLEGDAVTVIKDLKVKGGSSDLKRGTIVRKIHLTSDPTLVECRVDGSTLVLRTEFLKKSN